MEARSHQIRGSQTLEHLNRQLRSAFYMSIVQSSKRRVDCTLVRRPAPAPDNAQALPTKCYGSLAAASRQSCLLGATGVSGIMATADKENGPLTSQKPQQAIHLHQILDVLLLLVASIAMESWCLTGIAQRFVRHRCTSDAETLSGLCHGCRPSEVPMERPNPHFSR